MSQTKNKTQKTAAGADQHLAALTPPARQADCRAIAVLMGKVTGTTARMWGSSIVGFGERRLRYDSGRELDWFVMGFSSRKSDITLYLTCDIAAYGNFLAKLGPHKTGKGCLYLKQLAGVDLKTLEALMRAAAKSG